METTTRNTSWRLRPKNAEDELFAKNVAAAKALDEAIAAEGMAKGAITTNEGNLQTAQINLGYTDIISPIDGQDRPDRRDQGQCRRPDSGVLTTIVSQDPMYVTFPVSQREFLQG